ncbi:AAA family ATPase [Crenobacter caeni]|uniref:ATP-binding protein n=1 Tax=Crenobacter caeni TaxID=2705474 RepID=A0A6B2KPL8_9NEIS|nr:ATP-binding protein [Crenobacter caeni]NDV12125.1 ATP-binding protein [Crenobacter caeni]
MSAVYPLKIAIVGPESCGKSTLAAALAVRLRGIGLQVALVDEYAREYYAQRAYRPTLADVMAIAEGQMAREAAASGDVVLCDSTALTCRIWAEVGFGQVPAPLAELDHRGYALTLLARPDIPWQHDPLRSHPYARDALFGRYRQALAAMEGCPVAEVVGDGEARVACAWDALAPLLPVSCAAG